MATREELDNLREQNRLLREQLEIQQQINSSVEEEENAFRSLGDIISGNLADLGLAENNRRQAISSSKKLQSISDKLASTAEAEVQLSIKELQNLEKQAILEAENLKNARDRALALGELSEQELNSLNDIIAKSQQLVDLTQERLALEQQIVESEEEANQAGGILFNSLKGVEGLLKKAGFGDLAKKLNLKGAIKDATVFDITTKKASVDVSQAFKNIGKNLKGAISTFDVAVGILKKLGDRALQADKNIANLRRNFAVSVTEGAKLNNSFAATALKTADVTANVESLTEANQNINKQLGIQVRYNDELLVQANALVKRNQLSQEAAAGFSELVLASGVGAEELVSRQSDVVAEVQNATKVALNFNQVLEESNKISGLLRVNLGRTPEGIAKAVAQAKTLGITLNEAASISKKLLDFQSSIEAELEAELLTGKQLNLEQARFLALQGKTDEAAAQVLKQVGSLAQFQQLNVIQQEALANAIGLTVDQLADQVTKQAAINSQKQEGLDIDGETQKANASALSVQERLASAVEKLNSTLQATLAIIGGIVGIIAFALSPFTGGLSLAAFAAGGVGLGLGATALVSDGIAPSSKGPFTITDSYGATAVTATGDNVVVSPNVSQGNASNDTLVQEMKAMKGILNAILNKETAVYMDSTKVGTAFQVSSVKVQ